MKVYAAIGVFLPLIHQSHANLDVITLNTKRDAWIQEAVATLVVGDIPNPVTGDVALWSAIMTDKRDFLQGVTQNSPAGIGYCFNLGPNWCTFAYNLRGLQVAENGTPVVTPPGSRIKTHYKLNPETDMWDQDVYINDELVSHISSSQGHHGTIFYVSIECAYGRCAPAPEHSWEDISITLSQPDPSFYYGGNWQFGATGGNMSTADGGKTWNFTTLHVPVTQPR